MAIEQKIVDDFKENIGKIEEVKSWIDKMYYNPTYSNTFNKTKLRLMIDTCNHIIKNLTLLNRNYQNQTK